MSVTVNVLRKALAANSTSASFAGALTPTATKPSGTGVFDLLSKDYGLHLGRSLSRFVQLIPFGSDTSDQTFDMRLWGWSVTNDGIWIPQLLVEVNVTLGNIVATAVGASNLMADTLVIAKGDADASEISPANDLGASILVHLRGCELIEFQWDMTGAASGNTFWRVMDQG